MKSLKNKILEDLYATPANTTGLGQIAFPSQDNSIVGSDIVTSNIYYNIKKIKKKKIKHLKNEKKM